MDGWTAAAALPNLEGTAVPGPSRRGWRTPALDQARFATARRVKGAYGAIRPFVHRLPGRKKRKEKKTAINSRWQRATRGLWRGFDVLEGSDVGRCTSLTLLDAAFPTRLASWRSSRQVDTFVLYFPYRYGEPPDASTSYKKADPGHFQEDVGSRLCGTSKTADGVSGKHRLSAKCPPKRKYRLHGLMVTAKGSRSLGFAKKWGNEQSSAFIDASSRGRKTEGLFSPGMPINKP